MCGRLNIDDPHKLSNLLSGFEIKACAGDFQAGRFKRATDTISILTGSDEGIHLTNAIWWLLLEATEQGFKPSKYTSFNSRYDKLNQPSSAAYRPFRYSRCVIPVNGFGESEYVNGKAIHYHDMVSENGLLLGGLSKVWIHRGTGEQVRSCSVITLPPHPELESIHSKSMPLILPTSKSLIADWLDPGCQDVRRFEHLLSANLPVDLWATPIDKPSNYLAVGESKLIISD